jgi:arginase
MKSIEIVGVPSELGAGTRGASMGIDALRAAAREKSNDIFARYPIYEIKVNNDMLDQPSDNRYGKYIDGILKVGNRVQKEIRDNLKEDQFSVVLSGDHSMAYATIAGIKARFPKKRLGIVWVDAHADLHSPFTTPSGNMHGMPLAMAAGEDNFDRKVNEPDSKTASKWKEIKNLGFEGPKYKYEDLVFVGVRSTEAPEQHLIEKHNILNIPVDELRYQGVDAAFSRIKEKLKDCDIVYVSFDVDSMDPSFSRGTGTPVEHGITHEEAIAINKALVSWKKTQVWEMVEINPVLDEKNKMAKLGLEVLENVLKTVEKRKK